MRYYKPSIATLICLCDEDRIPGACAGLAWQHNSWWVTSVIAAKGSGHGMGRMILKAVENIARNRNIKSLRLGTKYGNYRMLWCAIKSGYTLAGCDNYGFVLSKKLV